MEKGTAAVVFALLLNLAPTASLGEARLQGERIVITGEDNTLPSVARDIADADIFAFDPEQNAALSNRNLLINGTLRIGIEGVAETSLSPIQVLEMNISRCGAVQIEVAASGSELHLQNARLVAIHETDDKCSDPNNLIVRGKLVARDSEISGNMECVLSPGASAQLTDSTISYTQDSALSCDLGGGELLEIRGCRFIDNPNYGIRIGRCPEGIEIRDSVFRGLAADVFFAGGGEVVLADCDFKTVKFGTLSGKVTRKWSVTVEVPRSGLQIMARSAEGNPRREVVRGVSDANGVCRLDLTEYVASPPRAQEFKEGVNNVTPHEISVYEEDGKTLLYRMENFHVFTKGQKASFR